MKIPMKLVYQYMAIFLNFKTTSNHLHPLQVENCDSNSRLVVYEDDNGKFRLERVKPLSTTVVGFNPCAAKASSSHASRKPWPDGLAVSSLAVGRC